MFKLALASDLKTHEKDHPAVARDHENLGVTWYALNKYQKAVEHCEIALQSGLIILGKTHPNIVFLRNNLGNALDALGLFDQAIKE